MTPLGEQAVWCLRTGTGTFVMRQGATITITGNSYQGGEKPNILCIGHFHKFDHSYPREVTAIQVGCTVDQTPFMRKKEIAAHVGGVTLEFDQDDHGIIHNVKVSFHPFYDKGFYTGDAWKYQFKNPTLK